MRDEDLPCPGACKKDRRHRRGNDRGDLPNRPAQLLARYNRAGVITQAAAIAAELVFEDREELASRPFGDNVERLED